MQDCVIEPAIADYQRAWQDHFSREHDPSGLTCESNTLRYRPLDRVIVRLRDTNSSDAALVSQAAALTGTPLEFSTPDIESDVQLALRLSGLSGDVRLRLLTDVNDDVLTAAHTAGVTIDDSSITGVGRIDLLRFVKEQSISRTMHRYGRLISS